MLTIKGMQHRIAQWVTTRFGEACLTDRKERAVRLVEEAIELCQAESVEKEYVERTLARVYERPAGVPAQEAAGVGVCILAYLYALGEDFNDLVMKEIVRIESKPIDYFRQRQQDKADAGTARPPEDSTAPLSAPATPADDGKCGDGVHDYEGGRCRWCGRSCAAAPSPSPRAAPESPAEIEAQVDALIEAATDNASCPEMPDSECSAKHCADLNERRSALLSAVEGLRAQYDACHAAHVRAENMLASARRVADDQRRAMEAAETESAREIEERIVSPLQEALSAAESRASRAEAEVYAQERRIIEEGERRARAEEEAGRVRVGLEEAARQLHRAGRYNSEAEARAALASPTTATAATGGEGTDTASEHNDAKRRE